MENIEYKMPLELGRTSDGKEVIVDLADFPHLLVAGASGSGKSVCLDSIIISLAKNSHNRLILIDTKVVGFSVYNGLSNLLCPVLTEEKEIERKLNILVDEMDKRYKRIAEAGERSFDSYNNVSHDKLDRIILVIDEYADLIMMNRNIERLISILVQKSRAAGIHIVLSTQRPSADIVTGVIKANIPARICLSVSSQIDSRVVLGFPGAERLRGKGAMIFSYGYSRIELQGRYLSDSDIKLYVRTHSSQPKLQSKIESREKDDLYIKAGRIIIDRGFASSFLLQKRLHIPYRIAEDLLSRLVKDNVITEQYGTQPRKVLMTIDQFEEVI